MQESFVLKLRGKFSLQEQALMTAEERKFYLRALEKEAERENEKMRRMSPNKPDHIPGTIPT